MPYIIGYVYIPLGFMILGAYFYLLYAVMSGDAKNLPTGACYYRCCYGSLVLGCIENYHQEIAEHQENLL